MKVLIIGSGGREHAMAWQCATRNAEGRVFVAPGNGGSALEKGVENVAIDPLDFDALLIFVKENNIDLTIVGPEAPLVAGIVDRFRAAGHAIFGPTAAAAMLEGSKVYCKEFLTKNNIPTAKFRIFSNIEEAKFHVGSVSFPLVIKADGLASGKGVFVVHSLEEAYDALESAFAFAKGGLEPRVIVEDYIRGIEVSFIVASDGVCVYPLATSQDHKARYEGNKGPNTGGMGAFSPSLIVNDEMHELIMSSVITPTIEAMSRSGIPYHGFLYAGLMIDSAGTPNVLEFNCRLGDPEAQAILMRLENNLGRLCFSILNQEKVGDIRWSKDACVGVVMAAEGYPGAYKIGEEIALPQEEGAKIFHGGTRSLGGTLFSNGGRVLCVSALGSNLNVARQGAYKTVKEVKYSGAVWREDIGFTEAVF